MGAIVSMLTFERGGSMSSFNPVFGTVYLGPKGEGSFCFECGQFPQGYVVDALSWARSRQVENNVVSVCFPDGYAVLRSRRRFGSREDAERALRLFLALVRSVEVASC